MAESARQASSAGREEPSAPGVAAAAGGAPGARAKRRRTAVLITADDMLWPLVGAAMPVDVVLSQQDDVEQLLGADDGDQSAVVVWDARGDARHAAHLAQIQQRSPRYALVVLDEPDRLEHWQKLSAQNQIVAGVPVPFTPAVFGAAVEAALEEARVRLELLGDAPPPAATAGRAPPAPGAAPPPGAPRSSLPLLMGGVVLCAAGLAVWWYAMMRSSPPPAAAPASPLAESAAVASTPAAGGTAVAPPADAGGAARADLLLDKARQAMAERRFIDPADNSALGYLREALALDAGNAEARQGMKRLEELLLARAENALDQRHFDAALQALESARSIDKDDARIPALDARVFQLRAELGASSIQAAINAGNYERAAAQIDDAAHTQSLPAAQLATLRDSLRQHQEADVERAARAAQVRAQAERATQEARQQAAELQAGHQRLAQLVHERLAAGALSAPEHDSAAFYLERLKSEDPQNPQLGDLTREFGQRLDAQRAAASAAGAASATPAAASAAAPVIALKLLRPIRPAYPAEAQRAGTE